VTPERIAEGKKLFNEGTCITCHGPNGDGTTRGPPLSDKNWLHGGGSFAAISSIIREGVNQSDMIDNYRQPMPARGGDRMNLTDPQVAQLAAYVYALSNNLPGAR
jgi:mono/diheme cytochrome c family protein